MPIKTYYHILNISPRASDENVRRAWRRLALRWHPDRNPRNRAQAQKMFILIERAYTMLKTKPQREAYNRSLLKMSSRRKLESGRSIAPDSGLFGKIKEIFWPFAFGTETRHG